MHCTDRKKLMYGKHGGNYLTINNSPDVLAFHNSKDATIRSCEYCTIEDAVTLRLKEGGATVCWRLCKLTPCTTTDDYKGVNGHAPTGAIKTNRRDIANHNRTFPPTAGQTRIKRKHLWRCNIICFIFTYILHTLDIIWLLNAAELVLTAELECLTNSARVTALEMCWLCHYGLSSDKHCMKSGSVLFCELSWIHVAPTSFCTACVCVCACTSVGFTVKLNRRTAVHTPAQSNTNPY